MQSAIDAFIRLLNISITLEGITFTFGELFLVFAVIGFVCLFLSGVFK